MVGDTSLVEVAANLLEAIAAQHAVEDLAHNRSRGGVNLQRRALPRPVADLDAAVAERRAWPEEEPARGGLTHPSGHLLRQVLRIELVDALDDRLHELAGGGVVGVLGDGDDADAAAAQHRLEGDGVLALAG